MRYFYVVLSLLCASCTEENPTWVQAACGDQVVEYTIPRDGGIRLAVDNGTSPRVIELFQESLAVLHYGKIAEVRYVYPYSPREFGYLYVSKECAYKQKEDIAFTIQGSITLVSDVFERYDVEYGAWGFAHELIHMARKDAWHSDDINSVMYKSLHSPPNEDDVAMYQYYVDR